VDRPSRDSRHPRYRDRMAEDRRNQSVGPWEGVAVVGHRILEVVPGVDRIVVAAAADHWADMSLKEARTEVRE